MEKLWKKPKQNLTNSPMSRHFCARKSRSATVFTFARRTDGKIGYRTQLDAMKTATRLMQASATAANALKRLAGTRHTVSVDKPAGDTHPHKSKTNVPDAAQA